MHYISCLQDTRTNPLLSSYRHLLREDNYFKCLPLIIASLPTQQDQQRALEQSLQPNIMKKHAQEWPEACLTLISMLSSQQSRQEKMALFLSLREAQEQEIPTTLWNPASGIMQYNQLRVREVEADPKGMLRPYVGYYISRKYDGWQMTWNGATKKLTSHSGITVFDAPEWWIQSFPDKYTIAGELIIPGKQATSVSSLRKKTCPDWRTALFMAFDILGTVSVPFEKRTKKLEQIVQKSCTGNPACPLRYVEQFKLTTEEDILKFFHKVTYDQGGQGVVLTRPGSFYVSGKSRDRLKLKKREDTEGRVVGYNLRDDGDLKSLLVKMEKTGAVFNLGIGFSDKVRHDYKTIFPMNTLIKFSYREITTSGKPKQARYVGLRLDR